MEGIVNVTRTADPNGRRVNLGVRLVFQKPLMRAMQSGTYITLPKPGVVVDKRLQSLALAVNPTKGI